MAAAMAAAMAVRERAEDVCAMRDDSGFIATHPIGTICRRDSVVKTVISLRC